MSDLSLVADADRTRNRGAVSEKLRDQILDSVSRGFAEQIVLTQRMIRLPSTRGAEGAVQDLVFRTLADRGYHMERFGMDRAALEKHPGAGRYSEEHSAAPIVVGTHRPRRETGRSLILQSHVDVVPAGPADAWSRPPFEPAIDGDWLYGRGGGDMKAGHAAMVACLDALRRLGLQPAATVHIQSVVEEESTGNGALMTHLRGYNADAVLIPEPEDEKLVRANVGVLWFDVTVGGIPVHVRDMQGGASAIDAAYRIVASLRDLEEAWNARKPEHPVFAEDAHPLNLNIGKIEGGDWASSVPSWCRLSCRMAIFPGTSARDAQAELEAHVAAFAASDPFLAENPPQIVWTGFLSEGYVLEPGSAAEATLEAAHQAATGSRLQRFNTLGYLDTRVYALYDRIPALCYGPIAENIHGVDERVSLKSLKRITGAMALFVADWCGLEPLDETT